MPNWPLTKYPASCNSRSGSDDVCAKVRCAHSESHLAVLRSEVNLEEFNRLRQSHPEALDSIRKLHQVDTHNLHATVIDLNDRVLCVNQEILDLRTVLETSKSDAISAILPVQQELDRQIIAVQRAERDREWQRSECRLMEV